MNKSLAGFSFALLASLVTLLTLPEQAAARERTVLLSSLTVSAGEFGDAALLLSTVGLEYNPFYWGNVSVGFAVGAGAARFWNVPSDSWTCSDSSNQDDDISANIRVDAVQQDTWHDVSFVAEFGVPVSIQLARTASNVRLFLVVKPLLRFFRTRGNDTPLPSRLIEEDIANNGLGPEESPPPVPELLSKDEWSACSNLEETQVYATPNHYTFALGGLMELRLEFDKFGVGLQGGYMWGIGNALSSESSKFKVWTQDAPDNWTIGAFAYLPLNRIFSGPFGFVPAPLSD